jgi:hypothetical protein
MIGDATQVWPFLVKSILEKNSSRKSKKHARLRAAPLLP